MTSKHVWLMGIALLLNGLACTHVQATGRDSGLDAGQISQGLEQLNVLGSVLYIAAHPDDENTHLLSWLAQERHYRTGYLSLTRGDGGQNLLGDEQGESLGLIRTHELLQARQVDGAIQFFSRANDFGFSKTAAESLAIWDKEQVLADVVWVIRRFQPDVIITRFPGDVRAGHGHHQASSLLAQEAFKAAADPTRFPEQLDKVQPWQAKRLLWNTWLSFLGSGPTIEPGQLKIDTGGYNPKLGQSYGEIAARSRDNHKSQGFGSAVERGPHWEHFALLDGQPAQRDLFEGIDTGWARVAGGQALTAQIDAVRAAYQPQAPAASVPGLLKLRSALQALPAGDWRALKLTQVDTLILAAAGVWVESHAKAAQFAVGQSITVDTELMVRGPVPVQLLNPQQALPSNQVITRQSTLLAQRLSQPYWLKVPHGPGMFQVKEQRLIGKPLLAQVPETVIELLIGDQTFTLRREVQYRSVDPIRGEVYRPVQITPPVTANLDSEAYLVSNHQPQRFEVQLRGFADQASGEVQPQAPAGWRIEPASQAFQLGASGDRQRVAFTLVPGPQAQDGRLQIQLQVQGRTWNKALQAIDYPHIPAFDWFPEASATLAQVTLKKAGRNIGYIPGAGDKLPQVLRQLGYEVTVLNDGLESRDLSSFDAIVTGVRAYNVNPHLRFAQPRLLDYVKRGGVLLVQYNTTAALQVEQLGPYPFTLSRDRVTEENAEVQLLLPQHPLLNHPNRLGAADFEHWVQERGLYFATQIDARYQTPLAMHDRNEAPSNGALLSADFGKGRFVYAPLSLFRQLPAGVPGAARLLANLLAR